MLQYAWWLLQLYSSIPWASSSTLSVILESLVAIVQISRDKESTGYYAFWTEEVDFLGVFLWLSWNFQSSGKYFSTLQSDFLSFVTSLQIFGNKLS